MSELPERLRDTLPPPALAPLVPRTLVLARDPRGRVAWVSSPDSPWRLPRVGQNLNDYESLCRHETPPGMSRRFATRVVWHRPGAGALTCDEDLVWLAPAEVLDAWGRGELELDAASRHAIDPDLIGGDEVAPGLRVFPQRTLTLPPATHTNAILVGARGGLLVDPGAVDASENAALEQVIDRFIGRHGRPAAIFLTHHHGDHVGGAETLSRRLRLPIWAHPETASRVSFSVDRLIEPPRDGAFVPLDGGPTGWQVGHTPGHAAGHLVLWRPLDGAMVAGDMVASVGTILIDPDEGDMHAYLASLERMFALGPRLVLPAHGDAIVPGSERLRGTLRHRRFREQAVLAATPAEPATLRDITRAAYPELPPAQLWLAERATLAHLKAFEREGRAELTPSGNWARTLRLD